MGLTTTVSRGHHAPKTSAAGRPGALRIGVKVVIRHKASWQPPQAYTNRFAMEARGPQSGLRGLQGQAYTCQQSQTVPQYRSHRARRGQRNRDPILTLLYTGTEFEQAQLDRFHGCRGPLGGPSHLTA
jgi:hypothetical protein